MGVMGWQGLWGRWRWPRVRWRRGWRCACHLTTRAVPRRAPRWRVRHVRAGAHACAPRSAPGAVAGGDHLLHVPSQWLAVIDSCRRSTPRPDCRARWLVTDRLRPPCERSPATSPPAACRIGGVRAPPAVRRFPAMAATTFVAFSPSRPSCRSRVTWPWCCSRRSVGLSRRPCSRQRCMVPDDDTVSTTVGWMQQCPRPARSSARRWWPGWRALSAAGNGPGVITGLASLVGLVLSSRTRYQRA